MKKSEYKRIELYMLSMMEDSAHDKEHIYRVLYNALEIAGTEKDVDLDVLTAACLLHDIGRRKQNKKPKVSHAATGSKLAYEFLTKEKWSEKRAKQVKKAIAVHSFRDSTSPDSIEAKILFDADKLDAAGALGIARSLIYSGQVSEKLYSVDGAGMVIKGEDDPENTFFNEYKLKLEKIYGCFYTECGRELALLRQKTARDFFDALCGEVSRTHNVGIKMLETSVFTRHS